MNLQKLIMLLTVLLCTKNTFSQCWITPQYQDSVLVTSSGLQNQNFTGSVYFHGSGTISNSNSLNNWTALGFDGSIKSEQTINYNSSAQKVYVNGSVELQNVSMSGGDTAFVNGSIVIDGINSNNSTQGHYNVILLSGTSSIVINGAQYKSGDTLKSGGNPSNYVYIVGCTATSSPTSANGTLPITLKSFSLNKNTLSWSFANNYYVKNITIQGSNDGSNWSDIQQVSSATSSFSLGSTAATANLVFLAPLMLLSLIGRIRNSITKIFFFMIMSAAVFFSCSKNDAVTNNVKSDSYEMYRLKITNTDGGISFSDVISK